MEIIFGMLVIIIAYFVKGFSGFGPSLVIVPFITLLYDPPSALVLAAFFDFFAGCILVYSVRKDIRWPFVLSVFIALGAGTVFGTFYVSSNSFKYSCGSFDYLFFPHAVWFMAGRKIPPECQGNYI